MYGAWFDLGRITRVFDFSPTWRDLAKLSIGTENVVKGNSIYDEIDFIMFRL